MLDFPGLVASEDFAQRARLPKFPKAFTRCRKLPLPALIGTLLSMRAGSQQATLDTFFGSLADGQPSREVSDRAFAKARAQLHPQALVWLNDRVLDQAQAAGLMPRWEGLRLVAADASVLMPALRACHRTVAPAPTSACSCSTFLVRNSLCMRKCIRPTNPSARC